MVDTVSASLPVPCASERRCAVPSRGESDFHPRVFFGAAHTHTQTHRRDSTCHVMVFQIGVSMCDCVCGCISRAVKEEKTRRCLGSRLLLISLLLCRAQPARQVEMPRRLGGSQKSHPPSRAIRRRPTACCRAGGGEEEGCVWALGYHPLSINQKICDACKQLP